MRIITSKKTRGLLPFFLTGGLLITSYINPLFGADNCERSGDLQYICGPENSEDVLPIGNTQWLLASGMDGSTFNTGGKGHIYLVNRSDKSYSVFFPGDHPVFKQDKKKFRSCPGPINPDKFSAHGLALRQQGEDQYRLYMTSHGEREAIEAFNIDLSGGKPAIAWVGCVMLPKKMWANSVAILSDGGFVATNFMDPAVPDAFAKIMAGKISGSVYEWHPGSEVKEIQGTEMSGANGILVSADDRWMYVSVFGTREVIRFDRSAKPLAGKSVKVSVNPDNLRWGDDGKLYTAGVNYVPPEECASPPCSTGWSVFRIDPQTLSATRITGVDQTATMQGASAAVAAGNEIWVGTYSGDRIGYLPRPDIIK